MSSRSPGVTTSVPGLKYSVTCVDVHRADDHLADPPPGLALAVEEGPLHGAGKSGQASRLVSSGSAGTTPSRSMPRRRKPRRANSVHVFELFRQHLVQDDADDLHPSWSKSGLLSAISSIGLPMPPGSRSAPCARSSEATRAFERSNTEPTPACPVPSMMTKSFSHAARSKELRMRRIEEVVVGVLDVAPGEIGLDRDGAHRLEWHLHPEGLVDQHRILVDPLPLHFDEALAHRLDEPDPPQPPAQCGK